MRLLSLALVAALIVFAGLFAFHASREPAEGAGPAAKANPDYRQRCNQFKPSPLATKYLENLHGIEIGASTQNSFGLKRSINVDFSDAQGGLWQDKACAPAVVNIVALGDDLPFKDGTLDYVLSSHVIKHFFDPIKALREWYRVIKPGGYIFHHRAPQGPHLRQGARGDAAAGIDRPVHGQDQAVELCKAA